MADRRNFLKCSMAGVAGLVVASTTSVAIGAEPEQKQESALATDGNVTNKVDVLVVGGGAAGTIAAIQGPAGQAPRPYSWNGTANLEEQLRRVVFHFLVYLMPGESK